MDKHKPNKIAGHNGTNSDKKKRILKLLSTGLNIRSACLKAKVGRTTCWEWRKHDEIFDTSIRQLVEARRATKMLVVEAVEELLGSEVYIREQGVESTVVYHQADEPE